MSREFRGIWIPAELWLATGINLLEKCILIEVDSFCRKGECFASNAHFSTLFGCSESSITRSIRNLIQKGYIQARYTSSKDGEQRRMIATLRASQIDEPEIVNLTKAPSQIDQAPLVKLTKAPSQIDQVINTNINNTGISLSDPGFGPMFSSFGLKGVENETR